MPTASKRAEFGNDHYTLGFKKNIVGIGLNCYPLAINASNEVQWAWFLSLFYGKQIAHKEKSTLFFNYGLDIGYYNRNIPIYNWGKKNDEDFIRKKIISFSVPLSVQYLYQLSQHTKKPIFLSFELGVYGEFPINRVHPFSNPVIGIFDGVGFLTMLDDSNMLSFNVFPYKCGYHEQVMKKAGIGISWVKTIGGK